MQRESDANLDTPLLYCIQHLKFSNQRKAQKTSAVSKKTHSESETCNEMFA